MAEISQKLKSLENRDKKTFFKKRERERENISKN